MLIWNTMNIVFVERMLFINSPVRRLMKIHDWRLLRASTNTEIYRHDNEDIQVVVKLLQTATI